MQACRPVAKAKLKAKAFEEMRVARNEVTKGEGERRRETKAKTSGEKQEGRSERRGMRGEERKGSVARRGRGRLL